MMSADDEPQKATVASSTLTTSSSANNLINEAFNLKPLSSPIGILPPSSSHFKPIQTETKAKSEPPSMPALFADSQSSVFDSAAVHAPVASKPTPQSTTNQNFVSNLPPPSSLPSVPPPPSSISTNSSISNPYSAKGALNKKVYDTGISVLPINQNQSFLNPVSDPNIPNSGLFIPPTASPNPSPVFPPSTTTTAATTPSAVSNISFPTMQLNPTPPVNMVTSPPLQQPSMVAPERKNAPPTQKKSWGWFSNVVEKVVTTIDPQMKEYIRKHLLFT